MTYKLQLVHFTGSTFIEFPGESLENVKKEAESIHEDHRNQNKFLAFVALWKDDEVLDTYGSFGYDTAQIGWGIHNLGE